MLTRCRTCRATIGVGLVALSFLLLACSREPHGDAAPPEPPPTLAATGLYGDAALTRLAPDVVEFSPQYPLWSDGAAKRRFLRLPPGSAIDARDPEHLVFPRGTQLWKEFAFERRVETRYLELGVDGEWRFATYAWNAAGDGASLAPERGIASVCASRDGERFDIPSRLDCVACHRGGADVVLGFTVLQLSPDRDPLAPHGAPSPSGAADLDGLVGRGLLVGLPPRLLADPPRIAATTARERAALGYLHANCGMCHNANGPLAGLGLELDARLADGSSLATSRAIATAVDRESRFRCGDAELRVVAGAPERSVLLRRLASRHAVTQMPPLGRRVVDADACELLSAWIAADLPSFPSAGATESACFPSMESSQ